MCMQKVVFNTVNELEGAVGIGYKLFDASYGIRDFNTHSHKYEMGEWYESFFDTKYYFDNKYHVGFHIFSSIEDCIHYRNQIFFNRIYESKPYKVFRVKYKEILSIGQEKDKLCICAKRMMILNRVEE